MIVFRLHIACGLMILAIVVGAPAAAAQGISVLQTSPDAEVQGDPADAPADPYGRSTPRSMVGGLVAALAADDERRVTQFLDVSAGADAREPVEQLHTLLDRGAALKWPRQLSADPSGDLADGLEPSLEQIGTFPTEAGPVPIIAERVQDENFGPVWRISEHTLQRLPTLLQGEAPGSITSWFPERIRTFRLFGAPVADWLVTLALAPICYGAFYLVFTGLVLLWRASRRKSEAKLFSRVLAASAPPAALHMAALSFVAASERLGVAVVARHAFLGVAEIVAWIALTWWLWRLFDAFADDFEKRLGRSARRRAMSALRLARQLLKVFVVIGAAIAVLDTVGVDVTTGLAALGIGGLALALGAQKSIENFVGSLAVIADQPVRVGDFCRVGDVVGTVEQIGMRSTRIRTLGRTVVTIPNADFSIRQIENYERRDQFWLTHRIALRYETTPDQLRYVLVKMREEL